METYTNEKGEEVIISTMDNHRLIHAIAKYARIEATEPENVDLVKALKAEAIKRLSPASAE